MLSLGTSYRYRLDTFDGNIFDSEKNELSIVLEVGYYKIY